MIKTESIETKRCPFCGGKASLICYEHYNHTQYFVECDDCHASIFHKKEKEAAIKALERRAND